MFSFNPDLAKENDVEDGDEAFDSYAVDDEEDGIQYKELQLDLIGLDAQEVDGTGTVAAEDRLKSSEKQNGSSETAEDVAAVPINENLFLDEDLDELDEELKDLDMNQ